MNELIEKLKDKNYVRAFGLMSEEEREVYWKVGKENCLIFTAFGWKQFNEEISWTSTYAIKPDYEPEPEYVDYEVTAGADTWLGSQTLSGNWMRLHKLPSLPDFDGFYEEVNDLKEGLKMELDIELAARKHYEGKKVFARFRRQK